MHTVEFHGVFANGVMIDTTPDPGVKLTVKRVRMSNDPRIEEFDMGINEHGHRVVGRRMSRTSDTKSSGNRDMSTPVNRMSEHYADAAMASTLD